MINSIANGNTIDKANNIAIGLLNGKANGNTDNSRTQILGKGHMLTNCKANPSAFVIKALKASPMVKRM